MISANGTEIEVKGDLSEIMAELTNTTVEILEYIINNHGNELAETTFNKMIEFVRRDAFDDTEEGEGS